MNDSIIDSLIEVGIDSSDQFLKVRETLTRIGIANRKTKELFQSCHILHRRGKYYILHFKSLYALDGRESSLTEEDRVRTNTIACLLEKWGLCKILNPQVIDKTADRTAIFVLPHKEKSDWNLLPKYQIGKKRHRNDHIPDTKFSS